MNKKPKATINKSKTYEKNVILLLEPINRYETNLINTLDEGMEVINEIGSENLKLIPDTFHMNIEEKSFEESLIKAKSYVKYIHFADSNRLAPGRGHINFKSIIFTLEENDYMGAIGVEILPLPDDYNAARNSIEFLDSCFMESKKSRIKIIQKK